MKDFKPIGFLLVLLVIAQISVAQLRNPLLATVHNFHIQYTELEAVASLGIPINHSEVRQMEGKKTFMQCSFMEHSKGLPPSPYEIIDTYKSIVRRYGGKLLYEDTTFASYSLTKGTKEYWLVVETYQQGKAYTLALLETEVIHIDVSIRQFLSTLNTEGHVPIYINFESGDATLPQGTAIVLKSIARLLNQNQHIRLNIEGHTDNIGSAGSNKTLSERRAIAVMNELILLGISQDRLEAVGMGQDKPVYDNNTIEGRQKNRRVELVKVQ